MAKPVYDSDADEWVWVYEEEIEIETSGGSYRVPAKLSEEQRAFVREYYGVNQEPRTRVFRDFGTWATRPGLNDDDNPLLRAAKAKLVEVEAKKRVPTKSGPPQLILDEPAPWQAARARAPKPGWADEIAHEIAEAEKAWDEAYRDAHGEHLQRHPELMVAACELMLETKDFGADIDLLADHFLPGFLNRSQWMLGLMQFFALEPAKAQYQAWLGLESGTDQALLARLEYHPTHRGWHCHVKTGALADVGCGVVRHPGSRENVKTCGRPDAGFDVSALTAFAYAFRVFNVEIDPAGELFQ